MAAFWLFFGVSRCYIIEYRNSLKTLFQESGNHSRFVRFYQPNCEFSKQSLRPFRKASEHFDRAFFWNVDCSKFSELCTNEAVIGTPSFFFDFAGKRFVFTQERTMWNMINFIEENSFYYLRSITGKVINPMSNNTLLKTITSVRPRIHCKVTLYHAKWSRASMKMWKDFRKYVAPAFQYDDTVKLYITDVGSGKRDFRFMGSTFPPVMFITNSRGTTNITSYSSGHGLIETINAHCGTYRLGNGWLKPSVGVTKQEGDLIRGFARGVFSPELNNSFYRTVFNAINQSGTDGVKHIVTKIGNAMTRDNISPKKHDELNRKINVLNMLIEYAESIAE